MENQIRKAAEILFLKKGYAGTSTTEIARAVGCNQALVHYYFRTKEKLFSSIFEMKMRLIISDFMQNIDPNLTFTERICKRIELHFDMLSNNPQLPFLIINELSSNSYRLKALKEQLKEIPIPFFEEFKRELQIEIDGGRVRPMSPIDILLTILSLNVSLFLTSPILTEILSLDEKELKELQQQRRSEHCRIVLASIKPDKGDE